MDEVNAIFVRYVRPVLRVLFIVVNNIYCIPTYLLWLLLLAPLLLVKPEVFWFIEGQFFKWLLAMVAAWSWTAGYIIDEVGEDISSCHNQECLILVNHQSTGDVPLLMYSFLNKGNVIPNMMWLMERLFKYTNFGVVSLAHGDFFIRAGKDIRETELFNLQRHLLQVYVPRRRKWLVLFPEGGFLRKRKATSQKYAKANNLPHLENVSLPRLGAMHTIITTLNPVLKSTDRNNHAHENSFHKENNVEKKERNANTYNVHSTLEITSKKTEPLKWIIDITIGYPGGEPIGLPTICTGKTPPRKIVMYYRRFPIEEIPKDIDTLTKWLYDRWVEKEEMLSHFYRTGQFPTMPSEHSKLLMSPQSINLDYKLLVFLHIFFITSALCQYYLVTSFFTLIW